MAGGWRRCNRRAHSCADGVCTAARVGCRRFLWPAYFTQVFAEYVQRWPDLSNWRLDVAQYANPAAGIVLTAAGAFTLIRRRHAVDDELWALFLLPLVFVLGIFTFFKTDHHLRQFAWVFIPGSVAALARWRWSWAVAIAGWAPVAAVAGLSVVRGPDATRRIVDFPSGWELAVSQAEDMRIEGIHRAIDSIATGAKPGPVLFDSNGAGFYVVYGIPHVSRHTWVLSGRGIDHTRCRMWSSSTAHSRRSSCAALTPGYRVTRNRCSTSPSPRPCGPRWLRGSRRSSGETTMRVVKLRPVPAQGP